MNGIARDLVTVFAAMIVGTLLALAFGASSFGVALTFGQIAFAAAVTWVIVRR